MIDDYYIKDRVKVYQMTRSTISLDEITEHLSNYIYHYPRKVFNVEHEIASDFYLYYLERIDNILLKYSESEVKFITWFTLTLRNSYLNFMSKIKRENRNLKIHSSLGEYFSNSNISLVSLDATDRDNKKLTLYDVIPADNKENKNPTNEIAENIFNNMLLPSFDIRSSLIFSLHNLELFITVIIEPMKNFLSISTNEVYNIFESARVFYIKKYNKIMKRQDFISAINIKIRHYEKCGRDTKKIKNRREIYIKEIESYRLNVPYSYIAKVFSTTENAVNKIVLKIKNFLKKNCNLF